jgi:WD40 repeat protein
MVRWLPDGGRLATASNDGTVRIWFDNLPHEPGKLREWLAGATK